MSNGALTALGSELSWYSTATLQANDNPEGGSVVYTWNGAAIPGYDLLPGQSQGRDDMAFTLSSLNFNAADVGLNPNTHLPSGDWVSEGSYSGHGPQLHPGARRRDDRRPRRPRRPPPPPHRLSSWICTATHG